MKRLYLCFVAAALAPANALAHPSVQDHAHPHTDAASYFTVETLLLVLAGFSIGGILAYRRRRKEMDK
ncbi:hypothetical protein GCM10011316_09960 [Roseibium aquae]|uniref:Secreted protein with PEP-CTERM sorting signal n=1 Tax=Roseibium aquae TaxID=1323746 RepID=A0A916TCD2_9HYPH|nr:hypothetical protein [Roseibium aquae]GGB39928.1 hypothetical protein GCM10011316_09960 [Roseibium aquae]